MFKNTSGEAIKTAWSGEDRFCWQTPTRSSARCCGTQWKRQAYSRSSLPAMGMRFWKGYTLTSRSCSFSAPALPGTDGIRVLRQLRREGCASEIFLISAFVSDHMLAEATELRVDYFLPKPFAFEALFDRMRGAAAQSARSALHPPSLLVTSILHELGMSPVSRATAIFTTPRCLRGTIPLCCTPSPRSSIPVSRVGTARPPSAWSAPFVMPLRSPGSAAAATPGIGISVTCAQTAESPPTGCSLPSLWRL